MGKGKPGTNGSGWKWDVDIYDRPGWPSFTYGFPGMGAIQKRANNEIVIRFDTSDESGINDDFYCEHYRQVVLSSTDGGMSWHPMQPDWQIHPPLALSDGTLVEMVDERSLLSREQQRSRLKQLGIEHVWHDDCMLGWDLWPKAMAAELRQQGLTVWDNAGGPTVDTTYLPEGVVATHSPSTLIGRRSTDQGATWTEREIRSGESFSHFVRCFAGALTLPDDTVLVPCYGVRSSASAPEGFTLAESRVFVLRSIDKGESFEFIELGGAPGMHLSESCLVRHPGGRIVSMMRGTEIHRSTSDDGGKTWTAPQPTGMTGAPLHAIALNSGKILCTYARRSHPAGMRAVLSHDAGDTWDVDHEIILRDDSLPSDYIGGPGSVQLDDDSIFTFYNLVKVVQPKKDDQLAGGPLLLHRRFHCYIAGSRYTEDYVAPLGRRKGS